MRRCFARRGDGGCACGGTGAIAGGCFGASAAAVRVRSGGGAQLETLRAYKAGGIKFKRERSKVGMLPFRILLSIVCTAVHACMRGVCSHGHSAGERKGH